MTPDYAQEERLAGLQELLFRRAGGEGMQVYALIDAACDPSIHVYLEAFPEPARCLFDGEPGEDLAEVAPWLVELAEHGPVLDWLARDGLGQDWGIFVLSDLSLPRLKARLKRVLKVQADDGKTYLFKYYRPRHLNDFLPTLLPDQLRQMYSGVAAFVAEDRHAPPIRMLLHRLGHRPEGFDLAELGRDRVIHPPKEGAQPCA